MRRSSLRRTSLVPASTSLDLPWDILDRLLIPMLCCHAAAIILSGLLNILGISDVSTLALFAWFSLSTGGAILFYHHLKVCYCLFQFGSMCFVPSSHVDTDASDGSNDENRLSIIAVIKLYPM